MPALKGTEASLSSVQCFLSLVSSSVNVSLFHCAWLDAFWTDLVWLSGFICDRRRWHAAETSALARHCPCAPHPHPHNPPAGTPQSQPGLLPPVSCVPSGFSCSGSRCLQGDFHTPRLLRAQPPLPCFSCCIHSTTGGRATFTPHDTCSVCPRAHVSG